MTAAQFALARADAAYARGDTKGELLWLSVVLDSIHAVRCLAERLTATLHLTAPVSVERPPVERRAQSGDSYAGDA